MKKSNLFALCLVLLLLTALASCVSLPENEANETIVIPFTIEGNNRIVLYATVNGVEGRFFWDTGAFDVHTFTSLDNLTPVPADRNPAGGRRYYIENGIIINGQVIKSRSIINYIPSFFFIPRWVEIAEYLRNEGFDGILGIAMFNGYWVEVSFTTSNIILHRQKPEGFTDYAPARTTFQGLYYWPGAFFVTGMVDGVPIDFLLDTGARFAFHVPHSVREYLGADNYRKILTWNDFHYEFHTSNISLMGNEFVGKTLTTSPTAEYFGVTLLGVDFLQRYDILFDLRFLRARLGGITRLYYRHRLEKADTKLACPGIFTNISEPFGIRLETREEGLWVWGVIIPGFAHDELGLMPGMTITAINGQRITGNDRTQLYEFLVYLKEGGTGELTVWVDGAERVITH